MHVCHSCQHHAPPPRSCCAGRRGRLHRAHHPGQHPGPADGAADAARRGGNARGTLSQDAALLGCSFSRTLPLLCWPASAWCVSSECAGRMHPHTGRCPAIAPPCQRLVCSRTAPWVLAAPLQHPGGTGRAAAPSMHPTSSIPSPAARRSSGRCHGAAGRLPRLRRLRRGRASGGGHAHHHDPAHAAGGRHVVPLHGGLCVLPWPPRFWTGCRWLGPEPRGLCSSVQGLSARTVLPPACACQRCAVRNRPPVRH